MHPAGRKTLQIETSLRSSFIYVGKDRLAQPDIYQQRSCSRSRKLTEGIECSQVGEKPRVLWADAVCINQADIAERYAQFAIMKHVYSNATKTLVWLGDEGTGSTLLFGHLNGLHVHDGGSFQYRTKADLLEVLKRPYWRRVWIIGEMMSGNIVDVHCGNESIDLEILSRSLESMKRRLRRRQDRPAGEDGRAAHPQSTNHKLELRVLSSPSALASLIEMPITGMKFHLSVESLQLNTLSRTVIFFSFPAMPVCWRTSFSSVSFANRNVKTRRINYIASLAWLKMWKRHGKGLDIRTWSQTTSKHISRCFWMPLYST